METRVEFKYPTQTIRRYSVPKAKGRETLSLPVGANILSVNAELHPERLILFVMEDPNPEIVKIKRQIIVTGENEPFGIEASEVLGLDYQNKLVEVPIPLVRYLGTWFNAGVALHVIEVPDPSEELEDFDA